MLAIETTNRRSVSLEGREFEYYVFPAKKPDAPLLFILHGHDFGATPAGFRPDAPLLFILHGHDFGATPAGFRSEEWNVICPMDRFGLKGGGCWYLGEDGDFFWLKAFPRIIDSVRNESAGDLYFWGSSMGGYAAILHGYLNRARAIYANVPQTRLLGSSYSESGMKKYFEKIFGVDGVSSPLNDLKRVVSEDIGCSYFLCFNQLEQRSYFAEQGIPFVEHINLIGSPLYLEVRPLTKHGKNHTIAETLGLFERYCQR